MKLGPDFTPFTIPVTHEVSIQGVTAGSGPPLLLIHGYPQTHLIWHKIASELTSTFKVVAVDLRGYGGSSKPASDETHKAYAKSTMANDLVTVMDRLNIDKFFVCGHDRGGRVTHSMCINHPDKVLKAMVLDIAPTLAMYEQTDKRFATAYWHWFFMLQPPPFPETAMNNCPVLWSAKSFGSFGAASDAFHPDALKEYTNLFRDSQGCHAMCEDYRAGATIDCEEQKKEREEGRKIKCPLMVLWGKKGLIEKKFKAIEEWKRVSDGEVVGEAMECGHYIPEEKPEELLEHILKWFKEDMPKL